MAPSLMDGFYHLPSLLMVVEAYIMEEEHGCQLSAATLRCKQRELMSLWWAFICGLSQSIAHHTCTPLVRAHVQVGVQAVWSVTWVQMGILSPQSLLDELIRLRRFLKLVVTPYLCWFQSMNIQLWQKLVHHHTVCPEQTRVFGGMSARTFPSRSGNSGPWKGESLGKEGEWRGCERTCLLLPVVYIALSFFANLVLMQECF